MKSIIGSISGVIAILLYGFGVSLYFYYFSWVTNHTQPRDIPKIHLIGLIVLISALILSIISVWTLLQNKIVMISFTILHVILSAGLIFGSLMDRIGFMSGESYNAFGLIFFIWAGYFLIPLNIALNIAILIYYFIRKHTRKFQ